MKLSNYLFAGFIDRDEDGLDKKAEKILKKLTKKYGKPEIGRNRATFLSKHCVIKFPLNDNGIIDNDWEASCSADYLAKGRYITIDGFVCVIQEKLVLLNDISQEYNNLPDWVHSIDGYQVGYDKKGRLKAYDFGLR